MRNNVLMIDATNHFNQGWYVFKGISIIDVLSFFYSTRTTYVYRDVISDKEGRLSRKLRDLKSTSKYKAKESKNSGTDILVITENRKSKIFDFSPEDIFKLASIDHELMEGISLYCSIHDNDWNAVCYFNDSKMLDKFMEHLKMHTEFKITNNWNDFS